MILVWGSGLYGKTDEIPGLGYVATKFGHLWYIPLIPTGSHFVIEQSGEGWSGAPIGMSGKSILLGWLRAGFIVGLIFCGIGVLATMGAPDKGPLINSLLIAAALVVALIMTKRMKFFTQASYDRACSLADTIGFSDEARVIIDLSYGAIDEEEAERLLQEMGEDGQDALVGNEGFEMHTEE